jgi:peptide/nickel transport system permease protein
MTDRVVVPHAAAMASGPEHESWSRRIRRLPLFSFAILAIIVLAAVFAEFLAPRSPYAMSLPRSFMPPFWMDGGELGYPFGTDDLGRDVLSRMIFGARISLLVGLASLVIGGGIGTTLGVIAGYFGGWVDDLIMRTCDAFLSFPIILFALVLAVGLGSGIGVIILAVVLVIWARFARMARGEVLAWKRRDFVLYAQMIGLPNMRVIVRHLLPNILNTMVVLFTLQIAWVILVEAVLSFLGAGIPPPTPSWGSMIAQGREHITRAWWLSTLPGLAIVFTCLALNLFGDWLQQRLDPRMRQM